MVKNNMTRTISHINNLEELFELLEEDAPSGNAIFKTRNSKFAGIQYTYNVVHFHEEPEYPGHLTLQYEYDIIHLPNKDLLTDENTKKEFEDHIGDILVYMISEGRMNDYKD